MADLIDRQAAIDAMMKLQAEDEELYGCRIPEGFDGDRAKEALEQLPSAPQWILVSERSPEDEELVLVTKDDSITVDDEYIEQIWTVIGFIREGVWHWGAEMAENYWPETNRIIAWMPLPEPYEEDNT